MHAIALTRGLYPPGNCNRCAPCHNFTTNLSSFLTCSTLFLHGAVLSSTPEVDDAVVGESAEEMPFIPTKQNRGLCASLKERERAKRIRKRHRNTSFTHSLFSPISFAFYSESQAREEIAPV